MLKNSRQKLGARGEQIALAYYQRRGYLLLGKNLRCFRGEIDLLLIKNGQALIVEVKTRRNRQYGWGEETINEQKIQRLFLTYYFYRDKNNWPLAVSLEIMVIEIIAQKIKFLRLNP